jgi:hypothetical protein
MSVKLNLYIAELWHQAGISPLGNGAYRPVARESRDLLPKMMAEHGVKCLGIYRLDPTHRAIFLFEARTIEDVRDVLAKSRFMHWFDGQIFPATRLGDAHKGSSEVRAAVTTSARPV